MRILKRLQLFLRPQKTETKRGAELEEIDRILRSCPDIDQVYQQVLEDVSGGKRATGAEGLTAEQIVKLGLLRMRFGASYRELAEQTGDSLSVRAFLNLAPEQQLSKSAIQRNLKAIKEQTWILLNESIKGFAEKAGIEDGTTVRGDTTTTRTNIHYPTDASLLCDSVRVLTRTMNRVKAWTGVSFESADHHRRARKKLYKINNSRKSSPRHQAYLELIRITRFTLDYAKQALPALEAYQPRDLKEMLQVIAALGELKHYIPLVENVIDQAYRRIVKKEQVPAAEKIVSIFEPHTDIIEKGRREVIFGHKVLLTTGQSSLVLYLSVLDGNPADTSLVVPLLEQHQAAYDRSPQALAFDGGFASKNNRDQAKQKGVEEITFSKNGQMTIKSLASSEQVHRRLMRFRAGIEGCISFLKRIFGLSTILDRTLQTFKAVAQCAACAYNLTLLARIRIRSVTT